MSVQTIEKKKNEVNDLAEKLAKAKTVISFNYPGLTAFDFATLRNQLHSENCEIKVYKNNISKRAAEKAGFKNFAKEFSGAKALAVSYDDVVVAAKVLDTYSKENKQLEICSGIVEGKEVDKGYIQKLANIPGREELLTQLAVGLLTPVRHLAIGLNMLKDQK